MTISGSASLLREQAADQRKDVIAGAMVRRSEPGKTQQVTLCDYERYAFDCSHCTVDRGFAQVDTWQDASYFGTWANPFRFMVVSYCEGDVTVNHYPTLEAFKKALFDLRDWNNGTGPQGNTYGKPGGFKGIDPGWGGEQSKRLKAEFISIGLGDLLH